MAETPPENGNKKPSGPAEIKEQFRRERWDNQTKEASDAEIVSDAPPSSPEKFIWVEEPEEKAQGLILGKAKLKGSEEIFDVNYDIKTKILMIPGSGRPAEEIPIDEFYRRFELPLPSPAAEGEQAEQALINRNIAALREEEKAAVPEAPPATGIPPETPVPTPAESNKPLREEGFPNFIRVAEEFYGAKGIPRMIRGDIERVGNKFDRAVAAGTMTPKRAEEEMRAIFGKIGIPLDNLEKRELPNASVKEDKFEKGIGKPFSFPAHENGHTSSARVTETGAKTPQAPEEEKPSKPLTPVPHAPPTPVAPPPPQPEKPSKPLTPVPPAPETPVAPPPPKPEEPEKKPEEPKPEPVTPVEPPLQSPEESEAELPPLPGQGARSFPVPIPGYGVERSPEMESKEGKMGFLKNLLEKARGKLYEVKGEASERFDKLKSNLGKRSGEIGDLILIRIGRLRAGKDEEKAKVREEIEKEKTKSKEEKQRAKIEEKERAAARKQYLEDRKKEQEKEGKGFGREAGAFLKGIGEKYRKLPLRYKLGISAALIGASVLSGGASTWITVATSMAMGGQRALNALGTYAAVEGAWESGLAQKEKLDGYIRTEKDEWKKQGTAVAAALAIFSGVPGMALKEIFEGAGGGLEFLYEKLHGKLSSAIDPELVQKPPSPSHTPSGSAVWEGPTEEVKMPATPESPYVEAPTLLVTAQPGDGYERMTKQMWNELKMQNLNPDNYPKGSDIERLLNADPKSINSVVHQIAQEHGYYKPDGTSTVVKLGEHMFFDSEGKLQLGDAARAPEGAPVTGHAAGELKAGYGSPITEKVTPIEAPQSPQVAPETSVEKPSVDKPAVETMEQAPAPVEERKVPAAKEDNVWRDSQGEPWKAGDGTPITTGAESGVAPEISVEKSVPELSKEFVNDYKVTVNPLESHVYEDKEGTVVVFGDDFGKRFLGAQEYVKANPGKSVWIQAEKPVLQDGVLRPWVMEIKKGWMPWSGIEIVNPTGPSNPSQIGAIRPENFTKLLK